MKKDETSNLRIWIPPSKSFRLSVGEIKGILKDIPDNFQFTIDNMDYIIWEIDWDEGVIDFYRDYKDY